ncbi:retropepsin-like aspartic protease [Winogradskyella alexanderae]|uniref:retropepsin-like aspartic protease n=1 Tax=Winogradskyella alexanderae TaxID=2877123 RepID=UPI001CCE054E|nr:aspartyl protease family protein [Winogradskyella alexanderae]
MSAQGEFVQNGEVGKKINFEFISNLIIIPIEVNGVELSFVLDTGVSKPILFNLSEKDSLDLKNAKTFYLHGLGAEGKLKALRSSENTFKIGNAVSKNQDLYVVYDEAINFTPRIGVLVHGIIGYDVFKDFVVEVNYSAKYIRLHAINAFKPKTSKKWKAIPMKVYAKKPYVDTQVTLNKTRHDVKLLIDTGSSDALWLFDDTERGIIARPDMKFEDYLGQGLSGSIYGERSKVDNFKISDFEMDYVNVAFPDSISVDKTKMFKERSGSLGGDILKRFNLFFDYKNETLYLKKNSYFKDPFTYNNSGIVLEHNGSMFVKEEIRIPSYDNYGDDNNKSSVQINFTINYIMKLKPAYKIVELRKSSNAYLAGIRVGDILININGKHAYDFKLPEINKIFHGKTGKTIRLRIERNGESMLFKFKLDDAFKKNEPSN